VQATVKVAFEKGFANTRTADIAKEAGISEGLIFKYFPTKSNLFAIIIKGIFQRIKAGVDLIINDATLTATVKMNVLIDFHFDFFTKQYNIVYLFFGHSDRKSITNVEPIIEYALRPYIQLISKILTEGIQSGEFRPMNAEVIAMSLIGTMQLNLISQLIAGNLNELEATKNEVREYILAGIKAVNR
jgi:TetR/AcrR family transcriptional regulator, fatty acid metabolism regulator protein